MLAPLVQHSPEVPYVLAGHSMGSWLLFELSKLLQTKGIPLPAQVAVAWLLVRARVGARWLALTG